MDSGPDPREFRDTIGLFATGVAVIALEAAGEVHAITANAVSSVSLDPMLVLFCPAKKSRLSAWLTPGLPFSVNVLRSEQRALSTYFAGGWREPAPPPYRFVSMGAAPRLEGCLASLGCAVHSVFDGGDHWIVMGAVRDLKRGVTPHEPLLFYRGRYGELAARSETAAPDLSEVTNEPAHVYYDSHG